MNISKEIINEWKSVSDEVIRLTDFICQKIKENILKTELKVSKNLTLTFYENKFEAELPKYKGNEKTIKIVYTIYKINDEIDRTLLTRQRVSLNCSWDEPTQEMQIVGMIDNGELTDDTVEAITHETEHLFQYSLGMEKRIDLYDKVIEFYKQRDKDEIAYYIALAMYYTFKHEQDAFAQQFYRFLYNQKSYCDEDILENFNIKRQIDFVYDRAYELYDNNHAIHIMNELGFSRRDYYKRLYFAYKRQMKKFENAMYRYEYEITRPKSISSSVIENNIKKQSFLMSITEGKDWMEKLKNIPKESLESFYQIFY